MAKSAGGAFEEPFTVVRVGAEIVVLGPGHMHGAFTAAAALLCAERLTEIVRQAREDPADPEELPS